MNCEVQRGESICQEIKAVSHIIKRKMLSAANETVIDKVTVMHGWIICYIFDNQGRNIYQKDLENEFGISRSTVTNILNLMEKKGYIQRVSVENDARLKKLILTDTGKRIHSILKNTLDENEARINSLLTAEEQNIFLALINKLRSGLEQM